MINLTYDPCLLVTKTGSLFGVVGMQTDDTVILGDDIFNIRESDEIIFKYKKKIELKRGSSITFNSYITQRDEHDVITIVQKQ